MGGVKSPSWPRNLDLFFDRLAAGLRPWRWSLRGQLPQLPARGEARVRTLVQVDLPPAGQDLFSDRRANFVHKMLSLPSLSASAALLSQPASLRSRGTHDRCAARMAATEKRIVVTGLGTVTALGSGDQFWDNLLAGESGIDTITAFDASRFPTTIGAECKDFDAKACSTSLGVLPTGAPSSWPTHRREARATTQSHAAEPDSP